MIFKNDSLSKIKGFKLKYFATTCAFMLVAVAGFKQIQAHEIKKTKEIPEIKIQQTPDNRTLKKLSEIEERLVRLQHRVENTKPQPVNLNPINSEISALSTEFKEISKSASGQLKQQINTTYQSVQTELAGLKEEIITLRKQQNKVKWLPAKKLPFSVESIDSIQQQNVVSINYNYKTVPIEKGDSLAGWTLIDANFSKQKAEFVNAQKEHVLIKISDIG